MKTAKSKLMILGELLRGKKKRGRPRGRQAEDWFEVVAKRQSERDETEDNYNYAKIEFESDKPVVIGFIGD